MIEALALAGVFAAQIAATWIFYRLGYRDGADAAERAHLSRQVKALEAGHARIRDLALRNPHLAGLGADTDDEIIMKLARLAPRREAEPAPAPAPVLRLVPPSTSRDRMGAAFDTITRELDALDDPALKDKRSW